MAPEQDGFYHHGDHTEDLMTFRRALVAALLVAAGAVSLPTTASALPPVADEQGHAHASHGPDGLALDRRGRAPGATYSVDNHEPWLACQYDKQAPTGDAADLSNLAGLPQVHAIYVYPAKTTPRFTQFAPMFQADARQSSRLLQTLGRDVRWDLRAGTETCSNPAGAPTTLLDITVFQSSYTARQLSTDRQFNLVANELAASAKFSAPNKKYVAWLDAGSRYCGQGTLWQDTSRAPSNQSEVNRTTGIVYRPYSTTDGATGGFCRGRTLLHELGHNLGAVQRVAPNAFDGAHCDDDNNDTMCYTGQATDQVTSPDPQFDYGKNDYWDPGATKPREGDNGSPDDGEKLGFWALNLSKYVCPPAADGTASCSSPNAKPGY